MSAHVLLNSSIKLRKRFKMSLAKVNACYLLMTMHLYKIQSYQSLIHTDLDTRKRQKLSLWFCEQHMLITFENDDLHPRQQLWSCPDGQFT